MKRVVLAVGFAVVAGCGELLSSDDGLPAPVRDAGADVAAAIEAGGEAGPGEEACGDLCPPKQLASGLTDIVAMTVDPSGIYVAQFAPAGFAKIDRAGGTPVPIAPAAGVAFQANDIRTNGTDVFLSQFAPNGVQRRSKVGGDSEVLSTCTNVYSIALSPTALYAASSCDGMGLTHVQRIAFDGIAPNASTLGDPVTPDGGGDLRYGTSLYGYLAVDGAFVYLTNSHAIMRLPLDFAANAPLTVFHDVADAVIQNLVVDDRIYVRTTNDVRSYDKNGAPAPEIIVGTSFQSSTSRLALAVDADAVYYANIDASSGPRAVIRRPKGVTSQPVVIAETSTDATAIAVDGPTVYWATKGGEIWRAGRRHP